MNTDFQVLRMYNINFKSVDCFKFEHFYILLDKNAQLRHIQLHNIIKKRDITTNLGIFIY